MRIVPVLLSVGLEVVHVATLREVHRVLALPLFGLLHVDQVAGVLHDEVAFVKVARRKDAAALEDNLSLPPN